MSLDASQLSREELVNELQRERKARQALEAQVEALSRQVQTLKVAIAGREDDFYQYQFDSEFNLVDAVDEFDDRLEHLEELVDTDIGELEYEQLTKRDKVRQIREALVDEAESRQNGKAAMDYQEIRWLFGGNPSPGHAYDLMRLAASKDGFGFDEDGAENNRVTIDLGSAKDAGRFRTANKATSTDDA